MAAPYTDLGRTLIAAQSHRRTSEPPAIATRRTRIAGTVPYQPASAPLLPWRRVGEVAFGALCFALLVIGLVGLYVGSPL